MLKTIKDFENYSVSSEGYVINTSTGRVLKTDKSGKTQKYHRVTLSKNNTQVRFLLHVLVASYFIGERPSLEHEVAHGDHDPDNNNVSNLSWKLHADNVKETTDVMRHPHGESHGNCKYTPLQVQKIKQMSESGWSRKECAEATGTTLSFVKDVRAGRTWKHLD